MELKSLVRGLGLAGLAVVSIGSAVACSGGGMGSASPTAEATPSKASAVPAGAPLIDQENLKFDPSKLTVKSGEMVYFQNSETALHTVTIDGKNVSGSMKKGDIVVWKAGAAKTYKVTCDYHPQMSATITVE